MGKPAGGGNIEVLVTGAAVILVVHEKYCKILLNS
jgi:hypothetical protein